MKRIVCLVLLLLPEAAICQFNYGSRVAALGNTTAAMKDPWNVGSNPAGIADSKNAIVQINFIKFLQVSDISRKSVLFVIPVHSTTIGAGFQQYGNSEYHESEFAVALAKNFDKLAIGIGGGFSSLAIVSYGSRKDLTVRAGGQYSLSRTLTAGLFANYTLGTTAHRRFNTGIGVCYVPTERALLSFVLSKKAFRTGISSGLGIEYQPIRNFWLRAGVTTLPFKQAYGFGLMLKHFSLNICLENFQEFGQIPQIELGYVF